MKQEEEKLTGLPENAFRALKPGEVYNPLMSPDKKYPEVNLWSVLWGIAMAILFSAAAAYLGLKVGQVFEAAIPIAIIAVGVSGAAKRKNALGENVIIQSIGASSGVIVAGAIFTLPALYILQESYPEEITVTFTQVFISSLLGGVLVFFSSFRSANISSATCMANILSPKPPQRRKCLYRARKAVARQSRCCWQVSSEVCTTSS